MGLARLTYQKTEMAKKEGGDGRTWEVTIYPLGQHEEVQKSADKKNSQGGAYPFYKLKCAHCDLRAVCETVGTRLQLLGLDRMSTSVSGEELRRKKDGIWTGCEWTG